MAITPVAIVLLGFSAASAQNWSGNGGSGISLTIFAPQAAGLAENQSHLPTVVQAEFVSNFSGYSAISVLDWERLDGIYLKLFEEKYDDNAAARQDLGRLTPTTHFMDGRITRSAAGYHLQMNITRTSDKITVASYSGTFSFWDLDNLTGIRRASLELLQKMNVALTAKAQQELAGAAAANHVSAQTALAKGITAQRQGTEVAAFSYYLQAAAYDPSMKVAVNRSSVLNANISSGNMGDNIRNDIAWRKAWMARLEETEQFFDKFNKTETRPYRLSYSDEIKQEGKIDYEKETVSMSIETRFETTSDAWLRNIESVVRAVHYGLTATGRAEDWGLSRWPGNLVTDLRSLSGWTDNFSVVFQLINSHGNVIGQQTLKSEGYWRVKNSSPPSIEFLASIPYEYEFARWVNGIKTSVSRTLTFRNVNANDITENMKIRVASINGTDAEVAAINGVLQIRVVGAGEDINSPPKQADDRRESLQPQPPPVAPANAAYPAVAPARQADDRRGSLQPASPPVAPANAAYGAADERAMQKEKLPKRHFGAGIGIAYQQTFDGVVWNSDNGEDYSMLIGAGDIYAFLDLACLRVTASVSYETGKWSQNRDSTTSPKISAPYEAPTTIGYFANVGAFLRFPINLSNKESTGKRYVLCPMIGAEYQHPLSAELSNTGYAMGYKLRAEDLSAVWLRAGFALERVSSRGGFSSSEFLFGVRQPNDFEKSGAVIGAWENMTIGSTYMGVSLKFALGQKW
jgi:hypothetical protein